MLRYEIFAETVKTSLKERFENGIVFDRLIIIRDKKKRRKFNDVVKGIMIVVYSLS